MLAQYFWGVLSDRWGRKPVILVSNVVTAVAGVAFGLAPNLWFVIGARMLGGLFNGSGVCVSPSHCPVCSAPAPAVKEGGAAVAPRLQPRS